MTTHDKFLDDSLVNVLEQRLGVLLRMERTGGLTQEEQAEATRIASELAGVPPKRAPRAILMAALPGAGKTMLSKALAAAGYERLCPDEEMFRRYGHYGTDFPRGQFRVREAPILKDIAAELRVVLQAGRDAVVDHGFWTPAERAEWRTLVKEAGGIPILVYLPVPHEVRWARIQERNRLSRSDANSIEFSEEDLLRFAGRFHPPVDSDEPHIVYDGQPKTVLAVLDRRN